MSSITRQTSTGTHNKLLTWEIAAVFFILLFGSVLHLSLIHISEPTRLGMLSRMPSSA